MFEGGEDDIDTFRIPAVVSTSSGTLLAFAEARPLSPLDLDPRYLVVRRSQDGGATWGPITPIAQPDSDDCSQSDPVPIALSSGEVVLLFQNCDRLSLSRSSDDGATWSEPTPLADAGTDIDDLRPGPGHAIQLDGGPTEGRLVVAADRNVDGTSELVLLLSDDEGATWSAGATYVTSQSDPDIDETALAELADGSILVSSRNGSPELPGRVELVSEDQGESFATLADGRTLRIATDLTLPVVQGSLASLPDTGLVAFSSPSDPLYRRGVRIWTGTGDGTWVSGPLPVPGPGAYSDLVDLGDGIVGLVVETGDRNPYQRIDLIRLPTSELEEPGDALPGDFDVAGAAAGRVLVDGERYEVVSYCLGQPRAELDGGWIESDTSQGIDPAAFRAHVDDRGDSTPLDLEGTGPLDLTAGISFRGPLTDPDGATHDVDMVIVNMEPCPAAP
ncbi:MAG: exo-alpha-sialidase [Acidimicrobiales bacterium]